MAKIQALQVPSLFLSHSWISGRAVALSRGTSYWPLCSSRLNRLCIRKNSSEQFKSRQKQSPYQPPTCNSPFMCIQIEQIHITKTYVKKKRTHTPQQSKAIDYLFRFSHININRRTEPTATTTSKNMRSTSKSKSNIFSYTRSPYTTVAHIVHTHSNSVRKLNINGRRWRHRMSAQVLIPKTKNMFHQVPYLGFISMAFPNVLRLS